MADVLIDEIEKLILNNADKNGEWFTKIEDIANMVGQERSAAYQIIRRLEAEGKIEVHSRGRAGVRIYPSTPVPKEARVPTMAPWNPTSGEPASVEDATEILKKMTEKQLRFIGEFVLPKIINDKQMENSES